MAKQLHVVILLYSLAMLVSCNWFSDDSSTKGDDRNLNLIHTNLEIAFVITEKDLIPEGLAYNPVDKSFYISSIHKHKIVKISSDGRCEDFTSSSQDGLGEVLGMKVDSADQSLWVCNNEVENGIAIKSMIHQYNLRTRELVQKFELNESGHLFNDLDIANDRIFITDSDSGSIYTISKRASLQLLFKDERLKYCNGLALDSNGAKLFVSSFTGVYSFNIQTRQVEQLRLPGYHVFGIDGLYRYKNSLVGIQNTSFPESINQYFFNEKLNGFAEARNLVVADSRFDVPTTGVIVNGWFYFIANSQMSNLENGSVNPNAKLKDVLILKVKLE